MSGAILIEILLKASLVAAVSLVLITQLKALPAAQRAWIAHAGLLLTLLVPAVVVFGPALELTGPWSRTVMSVAPGLAPVATGAAAVVTPLPAAGLQLSPEILVVGCWAAMSAILIGALAIGLGRLLRLQRDASVLTDRDWLVALAHAQHRMGLKQGTALLRSEQLGSPISWGLLRPTIVLSPAALQSPDRAEAILAHELAHVVRMDWANMLVARLATALFWFNPLIWLLAWQAHELREEAADDVVLRGDVRGTDYASLLVGFARDDQRAGGHVAHGVAPGRRSLKRRLLRVLDGDVRRDPAPLAWRTGWAFAAVLVAAPLAAFTPIDRLIDAPARVKAQHPTPAPPPAQPQKTALPAGPAPVVVPEPAPVDAPPAPAAVSAAPTSLIVSAASTTTTARLSPEMLAQLRIHGVTSQWIANLEREYPEIRQLSADQMVGVAVHRIRPEWIRGMREAGYDRLTYEQLTAMAVHRITPAYVRELESVGYRNLSPDQLISLRVSGVDRDYVVRIEAEGVRGDPESGVRVRIAPRGRSRSSTLPPQTPPTAPPPRL